jgi:hypothetical protein
MTTKKIFQSLLIMMIVCSSAVQTKAQQKVYDSITIKLFDEIEAIQANVSLVNYFSFNATYYMQDVDTVTVLDTSVATFQVNGNSFRMTIDSIESIQNEKVFTTVYNDSKTIVVQKPVNIYKQVMQVDIHDPVFQQMAMSGMTAVDSGTLRRINILFDADAMYTNYQLVYDTATHIVLDIKYSVRKDLNPASTKRVNMHIVFSNPQQGTFTDSVFVTDKFFKQYSSTDIRTAAGYTDFEVINMGADQ